MSEGRNRVRIMVGDRELELEGTDEFIASHQSSLDLMVKALGDRVPTPRGDKKERPPGGPAVFDEFEFGEVLGQIPRSSTGTDQMLLAGLFAQRLSSDNTFATKDANGLLLQQSVKVGNPSQCLTNNLNAKRVFKVGARYRVSKTGEEYLNSLRVS